jgi:hypothetical protein
MKKTKATTPRKFLFAPAAPRPCGERPGGRGSRPPGVEAGALLARL